MPVVRNPPENRLRAYPGRDVLFEAAERGADARAKAWWVHVEPEDRSLPVPSVDR